MSPNQTFTRYMKITKRVVLICCVIFMISGVVLAEDRDVIIGFHQPVGPPEKVLIHEHGGVVKKSFHLIPAIAAKVPENTIEKLKTNPRVAYVECDLKFEAAADEYTSSWGVQHIGSDIVHAQGINGTGIKIAILDTGIDYDHEDLNDNYKGGISFVQDQQGNVVPGDYDDSYNSHGTHVAGIIAAENNGIGVIGVAPNAEIYAVKVLDGAGFGLSSWMVSGIQWAVDNNMDIATMSIQSTEDSQALHDAVDNAYDSGILIVAAGGNSNGSSVRYPAAYDSVIAVTATDADDNLASFSPVGQEIELAAPGVGINSTIKGGYGFMDGTSMAAPHVAGVAALILSSDFLDVNGDGVRDNNDVRTLLHNAIDLGDPGRDNLYGYGLADAQMAVMEISGTREFTLTRTRGPPKNNAGNIKLLKGNYSVLMDNINLSEIDMKVYENGVIRNDLSSRNNFKKPTTPQNICVDLNVTDTLEIVFIPYGYRGSTGYVTIRVLS